MPRTRTHPGEVLLEEFMKPLDLSAGAIASKINVPRDRIEKLSREQTSVTADTALRLAKLFGTTASFWMNLQSGYEISVALGKAEFDSIEAVL